MLVQTPFHIMMASRESRYTAMGINHGENAGNARSSGSLAVSQASQSDRVVLFMSD